MTAGEHSEPPSTPQPPVLGYAPNPSPSMTAATVILWLWVVLNVVGGLMLLLMGQASLIGSRSMFGFCALVPLGGFLLYWSQQVARMAIRLHRRNMGAAAQAYDATLKAVLFTVIAAGILNLCVVVVAQSAGGFFAPAPLTVWVTLELPVLVLFAALGITIAVLHRARKAEQVYEASRGGE